MTPKLFVMVFLAVLIVKDGYADCPSSSSAPVTPSPPATSPPPSTSSPPTISPPINVSPPSNTPAPANCPTNGADITSDRYPNAWRDESVQDTYGKTVVKDPYRWLENADSEETKKFIEAENAITRSFLDKTSNRNELQARYQELYNYPKFKGPFQAGKNFFSYRNTGLQNQDVMFVQDGMKCEEAQVFIDPNALNEKGTTALDTDMSKFSPDGLVFAYLLSDNGSDWKTLQLKHVEKGDIYKDKLSKIKFTTISWTLDNKGFFYSAYLDHTGKADGSDNDANKNEKLYYHVLGNEQCKDVLVAEFPDNPDYTVDNAISDCGKYLVVMAQAGVGGGELVYIADLDQIKYQITTKLKLKPIVTKLEADYDFIANNDKTFFFYTNKDADNYKVVAIDIDDPDDLCKWKEIVQEKKYDKLEWAKAANDKYLVLCYTVNVASVLQLHELACGKMLKKFDLEIGQVDEFAFFCDRKYPNIFFNFESFLTPCITYHCDLSNQSFDLQITYETKLKNFCRKNFTTKQVHYTSKDGTEIPMYIVHKNDIPINGSSPAFMYGYGAQGYSMLPYFSINRLVFICNFGGVHAVPNIRGGGEFGEKWHKAGQLDKKQTSFDDFIAAAEFLVFKKYTKSQSIITYGAIEGGLLTAACLNQRPDLFGVVLVSGGLLDMLRYDKFTIGYQLQPEFGSASDEKQFGFLFRYSPLQNVNIIDDKQYPATMLITADHDDRTPPLHSLKFIATLQYQAKLHPNQKNPLLISIQKSAGAGFSSSTEQIIAEFVDTMCFVMNILGLTFNAS